jgi:DNA-directed RNA polymerase subunit L
VDGSRGIVAKGISGHLKRYLTSKFGDECSQCQWSKKHPITGNTPLEIDHMDGDAGNNIESNLRLLCPNCHALTPHFRNLNRGSGRKWRKDKYVKNSSN